MRMLFPNSAFNSSDNSVRLAFANEHALPKSISMAWNCTGIILGNHDVVRFYIIVQNLVVVQILQGVT
jgi:hypothetical protein